MKKNKGYIMSTYVYMILVFFLLFMITLVAALIGLPIAILIIYGIFETLQFANLSAIKWYSYILSYIIVVSSSIISSFLLYPKIKKIDFNISLKSVE